MSSMKARKCIIAALALLMTASAVGCGSSSDGSSKGDASSFKETVEVASSDDIAAIPDDAEKELEWFSYFDINPSRSSPEKRTDLALFEQKGGKINYTRTGSMKKYDDLAARLLADDPPDMFWYETAMTFPANCIKGMFQPVDPIVDFDSPIWSDVKETAEQYTMNGEHYVAPVDFGALSVMTYNVDVFEENSLDDPYELYLDGKWDWDAWHELMTEYVENAPADEERWGVNGWFAPFIFHSTGKSIITYDAEKDEYINNIEDPDLDRAASLLYDLQKEGLYNANWIGSCSEAFKNNVLFYAMGTWAVTPKETDNWAIVPMPKDPNTDTLYTTLAVNAYMWVNGSKKNDAMRCWLECARIANTQEEYREAGKEKFFVNQPYYTEQMYQMMTEEVISNKFVRFFDPGYGISTVLSDNDSATNATLEAVIPYLYTSVMKSDENDTQFTWSQLKDAYTPTLNSELKTFNDAYHKFVSERS